MKKQEEAAAEAAKQAAAAEAAKQAAAVPKELVEVKAQIDQN